MATTPRVHLNGTDGDTLVELYRAAVVAVQKAREAVTATRPHARDYYVLEDENAFAAATAEHEARIHKLTEVESDLLVIARDIRQQINNRKKGRI